MVLSTIFFYYYWLKRKEFKIPTSFHENIYKFSAKSHFFIKMKTLIFDLSNHNYWVSNIGNNLISLLMNIFSFKLKNFRL